MGDGEARAIDGYAVAEVDPVEDGLGGDLHAESTVIGTSDLLDLAHFLDDSGEEASDCGGSGVAVLVSAVGDEEGESGGFGNGVEFEVGSGEKSARVVAVVEDWGFWK